MHSLASCKFQITNTKFQIILKFQIQNYKQKNLQKIVKHKATKKPQRIMPKADPPRVDTKEDNNNYQLTLLTLCSLRVLVLSKFFCSFAMPANSPHNHTFFNLLNMNFLCSI
jgi:hypothetical protein